MLQQIAKERGMIVENRPVDFEKEINDFKEIGMCGTAAVVVKVQSITHGDKTYEFDSFDTIASIRNELTAIQCGEAEDKFGWMTEVCDVFDEASPMPTLSVESATPGMVEAEAKGTVQKLGSESLHGFERQLLEYVVQNAKPGNPESVIAAMDEFWSKSLGKEGSGKWNVRGQAIEDKLLEKVAEKTKAYELPVRCLEMGTYCGYSALRIAKNLPEGSTLLSVERDELFGAIATKIIEFAGLDSKVKIWMGTVHSELANITERLARKPADFVLVDHSKERFVPDLKLLEECGVVDSKTTVVGDMEVYPGDDSLPKPLQEDIKQHFVDRDFVLATLV
jgi:catechol O-methyltransferase